jgi:hypothetical protein
MLCYGVFTSAANAALENAIETIRPVTSTPYEEAHAYAPIDASFYVYIK